MPRIIIETPGELPLKVLQSGIRTVVLAEAPGRQCKTRLRWLGLLGRGRRQAQRQHLSPATPQRRTVFPVLDETPLGVLTMVVHCEIRRTQLRIDLFPPLLSRQNQSVVPGRNMAFGLEWPNQIELFCKIVAFGVMIRIEIV
jgi:hypothetical protein